MPTKHDPVVERLIRKWWKPVKLDGIVLDRKALRHIIIEAYLSAAYECVGIAFDQCALDWQGKILAGTRDHGQAPEVLRLIRERFGLEGRGE